MNFRQHLKLEKRVDNLLLSPLIGNFIGWFIASGFIASTNYINDEHGWTTSKIPIMVGLFIGSITTSYLHSIREAYRFEILKQPVSSHNWRGFITCALCYIIGLILHSVGTGIMSIVLLQAIITGAFIASIYFFTFDSFLSYNRGLPLLYVSHDSNAAKSDQIIAKLPNNWESWALIITKLLILGAAFYMEFKMLSKLN